MSNVRIQGNASGTGTLTFQAPNTNTDRTLDTPDNAGTFITTASTVTPKVPMFSAIMSASNVQTVSNATFTKVVFDTEEFDTDGWYDTSNGRFTPQTAGYYYFDSMVTPYSAYTGSAIAIYKNGLGAKIGDWRLSDVSGGPQVHAIIHANGSTDYFEVYIRFETGQYINGSFDSNSSSIYNGFTYYQARLVRAD